MLSKKVHGSEKFRIRNVVSVITKPGQFKLSLKFFLIKISIRNNNSYASDLNDSRTSDLNESNETKGKKRVGIIKTENNKCDELVGRQELSGESLFLFLSFSIGNNNNEIEREREMSSDSFSL